MSYMLLRFFAYLSVGLSVFSASAALAQASVTLSGQVADARTGEPLPGATISDSRGQYFAVADAQGGFVVRNLPAGAYVFSIRFLGFEEKTIAMDVQRDQRLEVALEESVSWTEGVTVHATRVTEENPVAFASMDRKDIVAMNATGRDAPFVLAQTPSLVATSDAGAGVGYTGLRIRGSDPTRINVTINGVPFNDSESQGVYWVNMPDIVSSAKSIQIQRGVGTSTNGAGAFGASINVDTDSNADKPYLEATNSYGSFNTHRHTLSLGSGPLAQGRLSVQGRLSLIGSDGFIDRSASNLRSFFVLGKYGDRRTQVRLVAFGGNEITYQSWNGVPESRLRSDEAAMRATAQAESWNAAQTENLLRSNPRTFNVYTYKNQVDHYTQEHYQLHVARLISPSFTARLALHYTYGRGYYEEYRYHQKFAQYGVAAPVIGGQEVKTTDLVRQRWLDNHFFGFTYDVSYDAKRYKAILGGAWNRYAGDHFGRVVWAQIAATLPKDFCYYNAQGEKYDFNIFWKNEYKVTPRLLAFVDLQYRRVDYRITGLEPGRQGLSGAPIGVQYDFFNPKAGLSYSLSPDHYVYASFGLANREPVRKDFVEAPAGAIPPPERLYDLEAGWRIRRPLYHVNVNGYWMRYENQLTLTGAINDVGSDLRTSVPLSYRLGVEVEGGWQPVNKLWWSANVALSRNKIDVFTETSYDYGEQFDRKDKMERRLKDTDISLSPSIIAGSTLTYMPIEGLSCAWLAKYVGEQFLDNTSNSQRMLAPYFVNDFIASYARSFRFAREIKLTVAVNNIFDVQYESRGYTYGYRLGSQAVRQNFYFPQAGINYTVTLSVAL